MQRRMIRYTGYGHFRRRLSLLVGVGLLSLAIVGACLAADAPSSGGSGELEVFTMLVGLLGGLSLFLFGMEQMAGALKAVAGEGLRQILAKLTVNRFAGAATGAFVTAVIQSSSVTTVLVVGFITAEVMSLSQAVGVIFGANVGTTITAQIIAFKVTKYALLLIAIGFAMLFVGKRDKTRHYGGMIMGLGLVFFGMGVMSDGMKPLRSFQPFLDLMGQMENPILGILISAAFTGLVQSSSATTGIIIVMASQGFITLPAGIALIFGANVGTCITALLASIGKPREAVRAGMVHIAFNVLGVALWVAFIDPLADLVMSFSPAAEGLSGAEKLAADTPRQIANAHTIFNIANTLIFLPFSTLIARLVEWLVPDKAAVAGADDAPALATQYLNPDLLETPVLAIEQARREMLRTAEIVRGMLVDIMPAFVANDLAAAQDILQRDNLVDYLQKETATYLTRVGRADLSLQLSERTMQLLNVNTELEHIGDVVEKDLVTLLTTKASENTDFSDEGRAELLEYHERVMASYDNAIQAFAGDDAALAQAVATSKPELVQLEQTFRRTHFDRLGRGVQESVDSSRIHLDLVDYLRRINSYSESIASTVLS